MVKLNACADGSPEGRGTQIAKEDAHPFKRLQSIFKAGLNSDGRHEGSETQSFPTDDILGDNEDLDGFTAHRRSRCRSRGLHPFLRARASSEEVDSFGTRREMGQEFRG